MADGQNPNHGIGIDHGTTTHIDQRGARSNRCKLFFPDLSRSDVGSVVHLVLWSGLLIVLWRPQARVQAGEKLFDRAYSGWLIWITALMAVSLILDSIYIVSWSLG